MARLEPLAAQGELTRRGSLRDLDAAALHKARSRLNGVTMTFVWRAGVGHGHHFRRLRARHPVAAFAPRPTCRRREKRDHHHSGNSLACCLRWCWGFSCGPATAGIYSQQQSEAHTLGSQILQLDLALERYGPAADRGRELLRHELQASPERYWGGGGSEPVRLTYGEFRAELRHFDGFFATLGGHRPYLVARERDSGSFADRREAGSHAARSAQGAGRPRLGGQLLCALAFPPA